MGIFFACNCSKNRQYLFETNFNRDIIIVKKTKKSGFYERILERPYVQSQRIGDFRRAILCDNTGFVLGFFVI